MPAPKILIVDDEPSIREILTIYLEQDGHTVGEAADGSAALQKYMEGHWDLVITDKTMPGMSGETLAVAIKQVNSETPVILLSGFSELREPGGQNQSPFDLVVRKPFTRETLRAAISCVHGTVCA